MNTNDFIKDLKYTIEMVIDELKFDKDSELNRGRLEAYNHCIDLISSCYTENKFCSHCGKEIDKDVTRIINGDIVCKVCYGS